ncbi:MAG: type II secretion system protein [Verrucomicrobiota bacterium]
MKSTRVPKTSGFTLVELLVVIVIIASLAALGLTIGPRMLARAKATESMQNIRQISPLLTTYAADHAMTLPPIRGPVTQPDGTVTDMQWNEVCLTLLYPSTDPEKLKQKSWWDQNKVVLKNPMFKDNTVLNPGYAMNEMIVENIEAADASTPASGDPLAVSVRLAMVPEPARTPLIAPFNLFRFRFDDAQVASFQSGVLKGLLSEGKLPIVFMDGHLEMLTPNEYRDRRLAAMPDSGSSSNPAP